jgi:hypothetical protein
VVKRKLLDWLLLGWTVAVIAATLIFNGEYTTDHGTDMHVVVWLTGCIGVLGGAAVHAALLSVLGTT